VVVCKKKILVINNNFIACQILATRLTLLGYKVFFASRRRDVLMMLEQEQFNLIILDTKFTTLNLAKLCYKITQYSSIPILIL